VALNKGHYTNNGVRENRTFSINIPSINLLETTDYLSVVSGYDHDKSKISDIFYGELGSAPMIQDCPITAECKVVQIMEFATHEVFFGEIVATFAEKNVLSHKHPDVAKIKPILYSMYDNNYWEMGKRIGRAMHIGKKTNPGS
jgi:flavin reductase (DIM6/NTAB) family NADH-FMN oxidoreductase RutF